MRACRFQSTHPVRGATLGVGLPDGVRRISIHAPREGCDHYPMPSIRFHYLFQSTHPVRGATELDAGAVHCRAISIHAPREGCDSPISSRIPAHRPISIHAPREGCDRRRPRTRRGETIFQSTHPVRGATTDKPTPTPNKPFQSTHPVRGATGQ